MMRDCVNAEVRDRLPDLVHDLLSTGEREAVLAHVSSCAACTAEVALLRELRGALVVTPEVNVARIVAAIPTAPRTVVADPQVVSLSERRGLRRIASWRAAAAIATLMVGGTSIGILARQGGHDADVAATASTTTLARTGPTVAAAGPAGGAVATAPVASANAGPAAASPVSPVSRSAASDVEITSETLADASDAELTALIDDIEHFDGTPIAEPEPVAPAGTNQGTGGE